VVGADDHRSGLAAGDRPEHVQPGLLDHDIEGTGLTESRCDQVRRLAARLRARRARTDRDLCLEVGEGARRIKAPRLLRFVAGRGGVGRGLVLAARGHQTSEKGGGDEKGGESAHQR
jgi:hypothetical protein